jgi:uncharacterized membrane protein
MDWWVFLVRIVHIGSAMIWFGGAIIASFFLTPTAAALGRAGSRSCSWPIGSTCRCSCWPA